MFDINVTDIERKTVECSRQNKDDKGEVKQVLLHSNSRHSTV